MKRTRFILVRHGETQANREMRYIGSRDDALTERGHEQAHLLAEALSSLPISAVYSSPRQRAQHTAQSIAVRHRLAVQISEALRESNFGQWEGLSRDEVLAQSPQSAALLRAWERDTSIAPPGGESLETMHRRVQEFAIQLARQHEDQTVLLASHVGPVKALLCAALGAPAITSFHIFLDPATISVVDWHDTHSVVRLVNSHAHLGWTQARWMKN
ncbi:MAG TPA: histidine phosphatase family protein [Ktedonobacteraceae bacterium]